MKGNYIKKISRNSVVACIMAAAITFSMADSLNVCAQEEVSGGNAVPQQVVSMDLQEGESQSEDGQGAQDTDSTQEALQATDDAGTSEEDGASLQGTENDENTVAEPVAPSELKASGTVENAPVYDGQSHNVQIQLPTATINVNGSEKTVVAATDGSGQTFYVEGLSDNKVSVTAVNVSETSFDADLSGTTVYNSDMVQVAGPATLKVNAGSVIEKRPVTLKSMNLVKTYDGRPLTNGETPLAEESGWVEGEGADYTFTGTRTSVGASINEFTAVAKEGTDLNNYRITYIYGDISVVERTNAQKYIITVEGKIESTKYSGSEQSVSGYILEGRSDSEFRINGNGDPSQVVTVTIGEAVFSVTGISAFASGKNAGTYPVTISGSPVVTDAEGNDVTAEFKFEFKPGEFTIEKRKVTLTSGSLKKKYNNKEITNHEVTVSGDGFAEGEGATYKFTGKQKKVGESFNYFTYELNAGTLAENYDIEVVPGVLEVTKAGDKAVNENPKSDDNKSQSSDSSSQSQDSTATADTSSTSSNDQASNQAAAEAAKTTEAPSSNANVLGAKRGQVTVDIENPEQTAKAGDNVLGARRGATDDNTNMEGHLFIFAAALLAAAITIKRDKRLKK